MEKKKTFLRKPTIFEAILLFLMFTILGYLYLKTNSMSVQTLEHVQTLMGVI